VKGQFILQKHVRDFALPAGDAKASKVNSVRYLGGDISNAY
jgi:hypothetical protein